jgi:O-antigen ligase
MNNEPLYPLQSTRPAPFVQLRPLRLPFLSTTPVTDLGYIFVLLPLWWLLGIEQFGLPLVLAFPTLKMIQLQHFKVKLVPAAIWLLGFIVVHLISVVSVEETFRYITFLRNLSTYLSAFLILLVVTNQVTEYRQIKFLLNCLLLMMLLAGISGILAILGIWQPQITSLMGLLLPGWIKETTFGGNIAFRTFGQYAWFAWIGRYFRVRSLFMFATLYASALALTIPVAIYALHQNRGYLRKIVFSIFIALLGINLIFTTGRIAMVGLLAGAAYYAFFYARWRQLTRLAVVFVLCALIVFLLFTPEQTFSTANELYEEFIFARGSGSFTGRFHVYQVTLEQLWSRPWFGWGTERDIPDFPYPAGSHSYYLGIAYRHGLFGLIFFAGTLISVWRSSTPLRNMEVDKTDPYSRALKQFLRYGRWIFIAALVNGFTDALDLDATTMAIMWLVFSLLIASRRLLISNTGQAKFSAKPKQLASTPSA